MQFRSQGPHFGEAEGSRVAVEAAQAPAELNIQSLTVSQSASHGKIWQATQLVEQLRSGVSGMRQKFDCRVEDVQFQPDGLPMRRHATASPLLGVCSS